VSGDPARDLVAVDPALTALVDAPLNLPGGAPGRAELLEDAPGRIRVRAHAPARRLLVLTEAHHVGWRASCDAAPCPVVPVFGDFLGAVVEAGVHEVAFRFEPPSVTRGLWLALAGALATGLYPIAAAVRRRAAARAPSA
jgi:hypothetical protein